MQGGVFLCWVLVFFFFFLLGGSSETSFVLMVGWGVVHCSECFLDLLDSSNSPLSNSVFFVL